MPISPNTGMHKAWFEALKKENKSVCVCVYACMARFCIFCEVQNAKTARTHKHPYASYEFVSRLSAWIHNLNVNLRLKWKKSQIRVNFDPPKCRCVCVLDVCMYGIFAVNTRKKYTQTSKHTNILIVFTGFQGFLKVKKCLKLYFIRKFTCFST